MQLVYIAIALLVIIVFIWLAVQPKQGARAANAPDDTPDDTPDLLPKPQEEPPNRVTSTPDRNSRHLSQTVDYELPDDDLELPAKQPPANVTEQVRALMEQGRKIDAIKLLRSVTECGLKEVKDYVETFPNLGPLPNCSTPSMASHPAVVTDIDREQVWALREQGQKIRAIKLVRESTGWSLKDAKAYVEQLSDAPGHVAAESFDIDRHTVNDRLRMLLQQKRKVSAVKLVRQVKACSLKDAVAYVEAYPDVKPLPVKESGPICDRIRELLAQQQTMAAAELVQQRTGMTLPEVTEYLKQHFEGDSSL
ncbi:MAG: ribosomal protein L7/L12 [Cyanobacteria bacterium P01_H01_bin.105]